MVSNLILGAAGVFFIWLLVLTIVTWKAISHYNKLTGGVAGKNLKSILEDLLKEVSLSKRDLESLKLYCSKLQRDGLLHIQKVGLVRFNPFKDTGGDQSFILSLIDGNDTGVIISGLYSRSGARWYAKKIVNGKATEYELSEEEKKALEKARQGEAGKN